ncbi:isoprenoid biosynthesis glyoxalase ElbB [candidate division KSB1 bacterium]|nr:isoprenoid biosynthesis glyoxalase ElbB [candidate division KSB1 bacterium]
MSASKTMGVVLAGCGVYDGSEIHEAVMTLYWLDRLGAKVIIMAPDMSQMHVVDHLAAAAVEDETRQVLREAARLARGQIQNINKIKAIDLDGLIFPGGYGAAKNLCNFASKGIDCKVNPDVARLIKEMHAQQKPQGFECISPVIAAKVLGEFEPRLTIGNDPETATAIEKMGGKHVVCKVHEIVEDPANKLVSTPAYMLGTWIAEVSTGIEKLVQRVLEWA